MNELKEKELIETNAILQESLTKENEKYYGNLLIYIRIMAFFRDVKKSEELIYIERITQSKEIYENNIINLFILYQFVCRPPFLLVKYAIQKEMNYYL